MTSPLTPVPDLPWDYADADGIRLTVGQGPDGEAVLRAHGHTAAGPAGTTLAVIPGGDVAAVAAALLAAAGSTARVIELGEAGLPEVERDADDDCWRADTTDGTVYVLDDNDDAWYLGQIRGYLAGLEARDKARAAKPAKPAHDPAEVDVVGRLVEWYAAEDLGSATEVSEKAVTTRTNAILDALAAVRGAR